MPSKTTTNSRNILLVFHYLCKLGNRHRGSAASGGQLPRVIGRERAMVLIGPIIIAVVLMALLVLGVSGIGGSRPVLHCQSQGRTGHRPDTGTVTS